MLTIEKANPQSVESLYLIEKLSAELAAITGSSGKNSFTIDSMKGGKSLWVLAKNERGESVGCGAIRQLSESIAELKRMYSDRSLPGIGQALLTFLEISAHSMGYSEIWLETRVINQRAVSFYKNNGYRIIENYGPYTGVKEAVCFSKILTHQPAGL